MRVEAGPSLLVVLAVVSLLGVAGAALADGIEVRLLHCPDGSVQRDDHSGSYCAATTCADDAICGQIMAGSFHPSASGYQCAPDRGLCVETQTYRDGHARTGEGGPVMRERLIATGTCTAGSSCPDGTACQMADRCMPRPASRFGCAVTLGSPRRAPAVVLLALSALVARLARDRRRPSPRASGR